MNIIETPQNQNMVAAEPLVSNPKPTSSNQYRSSKALAAMHNIETLHNKKMVVAENVGFRLEADFFKSVPMILGCGCHGKHRDAPP